MKKLTHKQQLRLIEGLCMLWENSDRTAQTAENYIAEIYQYAHLNLSCKNKHSTWHQNGFILGDRLKKQGITDINR
jgi:hypothetical protein